MVVPISWILSTTSSDNTLDIINFFDRTGLEKLIKYYVDVFKFNFFSSA